MPTYIVLSKLTDQAVKNIKDMPGAVETERRRLEALGGRLVASYLVMGEYDGVSIVELPDDEAMLTRLLRIAAAGNSRTTTLRAFRAEEFAEVVKKAFPE